MEIKYKITNESHWNSLRPLLFLTIVYTFICIYFAAKNDGRSHSPEIKAGIWIYVITTVLFLRLYITYLLANNNDLLVFDTPKNVIKYLHKNNEIEFNVKDINNIKYFITIDFRNKAKRILP